jgi:hypothetical protein
VAEAGAGSHPRSRSTSIRRTMAFILVSSIDSW